MKTGFSRDNRGYGAGRSEHDERLDVTLGDWLGRVIRAEDADERGDDRASGRDAPRQRQPHSGASRPSRRHARDYDRQDFAAADDRRERDGWGAPRRDEGAARRTEQALAAVERWIRDSEGRKRGADSRQTTERDARLSQALEHITRRLDSLDERIEADAGHDELGAIKHTMERLEQRIEMAAEAAITAGQRDRDQFEADLDRRIGDIGRRIEQMSKGQQGDSGGAARLERLESLMEKMSRTLEQSVADRPVLNGPRRRALAASTSLSDPGGLAGAMAEIKAHKMRLAEPARTSAPEPAAFEMIGREIEQAQERAFARVAPTFDTIRSEIAKLANQIADTRRQSDSGDLRAELAALRQAVAAAASAKPAPAPALADVLDEVSARMRQEFAQMNRAVSDRIAAVAPPQDAPRIEPITEALDDLSTRLETAGSRIATDLRRDFQSAITDLRQAVATQRPAISMEPVEAAIRDLSRRLETLSNQPGVDSAILIRTNLELAEMREMVGKAANPLALDRIEKHLAELGARIESSGSDRAGRGEIETLSKELRQLARQFDPALALNAMDDKLRALEERIAVRMGQTQSIAGEGASQGLSGDILAPDVSGLETMMRALSDKIDAARQPDAGLPQMEALQRQIASIAARLDRSDDGARALSSIERAVSDLFQQMDGLRDVHRETAEIAARKAAEMLAAAPYDRAFAGERSVAHPRIDALAEDVNALLRSRDSIDRRTQDTLEAVHGALEKIVGRLSSLEREVTAPAQRRDAMQPLPAEGLPVRAAIDAAAKAASDMGRQASGKGLEARIAGEAKSREAVAAEPSVDPSVLVRPGSRRAQPVVEAPVPQKTSRFALKLPFLKGKGDQPAKPPAPAGQPEAARPLPSSPAGDFETADMALARLSGPAPAGTPAKAAAAADVPLEPGSGRPDSSQADMSARLVAAARRAAQSAVEETASAKSDKGKAKAGAQATPDSERAGVQSFLAARKRPLLLGLGGLAMAAMLINIASSMLNPPPVVAIDQSARPKPVEKILPPQEPGQNRVIPGPRLPTIEDERLPTPATEGEKHSRALQEPATVGAIPATKPLDITPSPSLLNPAPLNPPGAAPPAAASLPAPVAAPAAAPAQIAALAPADLPQGLTSSGLKAAVARGDIGALYEVGSRLMDGKGVTRDAKQAFGWFERAAQAGLAPAQFRVGNMYEKGIGVSRDLRQARFWYGKAADKGNAKAIHNLGVIIAEGGDGKPDYTVASDLFRRAAQFGIRDSQYNIAILLARGLGVGQNMRDAYTWFAIAAAQGDEEAGRKRDEVGARLAPEDLAAAKAAVTSFKPLAQDVLANDVPERVWDTPTLGRPKTSDAKPAPRITGSARL